jgi:hypothetical protein
MLEKDSYLGERTFNKITPLITEVFAKKEK